MPGLSFRQLLEQFLTDLERTGASVLVSSGMQSRPSRLSVIAAESVTACEVYLWTITPGGGPPGVRPPRERRIQLTNVECFPLKPGIRTVIGGWSQEYGAYAFWDARRHSQFSQRSPSLQVSADCLEEAASQGLATYVRQASLGPEVVVALGADGLLWYLQEGCALHNCDEDAQAVVEMRSPNPEEERSFVDNSSSEAQASRRLEVVETMRAYRESRFRPEVLRAYSYRCAVCSSAMKLVDAAHIVPVAHPQSTDDVTNGIALCRQHHGAFDIGLLGVRSDYRLILNRNFERRLREIQLHHGLEPFRAALPEAIALPSELEVRPDPRNLKLALQVRQWPEDQIA